MSKPNRVILECTVFATPLEGRVILIRCGGLAMLYGGYGLDTHEPGGVVEVETTEHCPAFGVKVRNRYQHEEGVSLRRAIDLASLVDDESAERMLDEAIHGVVSDPRDVWLATDRDILEAGAARRPEQTHGATDSYSSPQAPGPDGQPESARQQSVQLTGPTPHNSRPSQTSDAPLLNAPAASPEEAEPTTPRSIPFPETSTAPDGCKAGASACSAPCRLIASLPEMPAAAEPGAGSISGERFGWIVKLMPWRGLRSRVFRCRKCTSPTSPNGDAA